MTTVCLDASLLLDWLLPTLIRGKVDALWHRWAEEDVELIAPLLLFSETTSGLRRWVHTGRISGEEGEVLFQRFCQVDLRTITYPDLHIRAWQLAAEFNQPRAYDAHYLAVAEREGCELWTADGRLYNAVQPDLTWVKLVAA